jgi:hypothetical protein
MVEPRGESLRPADEPPGSSRSPAAARGWSRLDRVLLAGLVVIGATSLPLLVHPWFDVIGDASIYVATARNLLAGQGYTYLEMPFHERPPGLSLLLAPVLAVSGSSPVALNGLIGVTGLAGVVLLFVHQRPRVGGPLAALLALVVWTNPGYQRFATQILSDVPGLAAVLGCLLVARWSQRTASTGREIVLGLAVGLATYLRAASALLLPAILLARLLGPESPFRREGPSVRVFLLRRVVPFAATLLAVVAPWAVRNAAHPPELPVDQFVVYDYATAQWHESWTDPTSRRLSVAEVLARVTPRSHALVKSLGSRMQWGTFDEGPGRRVFDPWEVVVTAVLALGLVVTAIRRRDAASFFALGLAAVLLVYFDYHARLALPVYVIALAACVDAGRWAVDRVAGPGRGVVVLGALLALVLVVDFDPRRGWEGIRRRHLDLQERCAALERVVGPDTRLATSLGWHYSMCLGRPVFGIAQRIFREENATAAEKVIDRYRIDTVFLDARSRYDARFRRYFELRYGAPQRTGPLLYWRVRGGGGDR